MYAQLLSHILLFATSWTVACQAPLSMGFSRQEYWSGLPFPPPRDLPNPGTKPASPTFYHWATWEAQNNIFKDSQMKQYVWNMLCFTSKGRKCGDGCTKISWELITWIYIMVIKVFVTPFCLLCICEIFHSTNDF